MVALAGVDGSGKSFLLDRLRQRLNAAGIPHRHVWTRFRNYLSKPFLALARVTGHNRKEAKGGVRTGYHEFAGRPWLAWPFLCLQVVDNLIDVWWRYHRTADRRAILADRCIHDTLVDLAVDTGLDDVVFGRLGRWLTNLLPAPRLVVVLSRPVAEIRATRPDALLDRNFARRRALYRRLARDFGLPILENQGPPEQVLDRLEQLAAAAPPGNGPVP
jgi:thymidylate kinase